MSKGLPFRQRSCRSFVSLCPNPSCGRYPHRYSHHQAKMGNPFTTTGYPAQEQRTGARRCYKFSLPTYLPTPAFIKSIFNANGEPTNEPDYTTVKILQYPWHIFQWNDWALREDFQLITKGRQSEPIPDNSTGHQSSAICLLNRAPC